MCQTPAFKYKAIANNQNAPQAIRDAANLQIKAQTKTQETLKIAKSTVLPPTSGNKQFTCTIYSLQNKDFWENLSEPDQRAVTNPGEMTSIPGIKVQDSTGFVDAGQDAARKQAYDGLKHVYDFYKTVFGRESIDGAGLEIRASIHHSRGIDNAFWHRTHKQMVFGDGGRFDGRGWLAPTEKEVEDDLHERNENNRRNYAVLSEWFDNCDIDTIGHELTHGVVQFTAGLGTRQANNAKRSEAATLNEHIADCFAIALKHWVNKQDSEHGNWDFSPNVYTKTAMKAMGWEENYCRTFRVTKAKSIDTGPKHWDHRENFDQGKKGGLDPHVNCGIPSHAFYQAALAFRGNTCDTVGKIWYDALTDPDFAKPANHTFQFWRDVTVKHAEKRFATQGKDIMVKAWQKVGL